MPRIRLIPFLSLSFCPFFYFTFRCIVQMRSFIKCFDIIFSSSIFQFKMCALLSTKCQKNQRFAVRLIRLLLKYFRFCSFFCVETIKKPKRKFNAHRLFSTIVENKKETHKSGQREPNKELEKNIRILPK